MNLESNIQYEPNSDEVDENIFNPEYIQNWLENWKLITDSLRTSDGDKEADPNFAIKKTISDIRNLKSKLMFKSPPKLTLKDQKGELEKVINILRSRIQSNPYDKQNIGIYLTKMEEELNKIRADIFRVFYKFDTKIPKNSSKHSLASRHTQKEFSIEKKNVMRSSVNSGTHAFKPKILKTTLTNTKSKDSLTNKIMAAWSKNRPQFDEYYGKDDNASNLKNSNVISRSNLGSESNELSRKSSMESSSLTNQRLETRSGSSILKQKAELKPFKKAESNSLLEKFKQPFKFGTLLANPSTTSVSNFSKVLEKIGSKPTYKKDLVGKPTAESIKPIDKFTKISKQFANLKLTKQPNDSNKNLMKGSGSEKFKNLFSEKFNKEKPVANIKYENSKKRLDTLINNFKSKNQNKANHSDSTQKKKTEDKSLLIEKEFEEIDMLIFQAKLVKS